MVNLHKNNCHKDGETSRECACTIPVLNSRSFPEEFSHEVILLNTDAEADGFVALVLTFSFLLKDILRQIYPTYNV